MRLTDDMKKQGWFSRQYDCGITLNLPHKNGTEFRISQRSESFYQMDIFDDRLLIKHCDITRTVASLVNLAYELRQRE